MASRPPIAAMADALWGLHPLKSIDDARLNTTSDGIDQHMSRRG
jgi:hypothetical protein